MLDEKKLAFTPAVEISFIRPKHQKYIAVSIEGQQSSPSLSQAQRLRKMDQEGKLNGDVIDGILMEEKKEVDKVIINSAELEKYFGKDKSPRQMKDQIMALLDDWKAKQPPPSWASPKRKRIRTCNLETFCPEVFSLNGGFDNETTPRIYHRCVVRQRCRKRKTGGTVLPFRL